MEEEVPSSLGWHTMSGEFFLEALRRCYNGENPDLVFAELYANASERVDYRDSDSDLEDPDECC